MGIQVVRGVIAAASIEGPERFVFAVGHPHPDGDHGGGPGPATRWREPSSFGAYVDLVDELCDPDDASWELDVVDHLASFRDGQVDLVALPNQGRIGQLVMPRPDQVLATVLWGNSLSYVARVNTTTRAVETFSPTGVPEGAHVVHAALVGEQVLLLAVLGGATRAGLARLEGEALVWAQDLGTIPEEVTALDARLTADGALVAYAGGEHLWQLTGTRWADVHSGGGGPCVRVVVLSDGGVVAGNERGDVVAGRGLECRQVARLGELRSAAQFRGSLYVADQERVYRLDDGPTPVFTPPEESVGDWPSTGALVGTADRLYLAGAHSLASTADGTSWSLHDIGEPERVFEPAEPEDGESDEEE